ncbi:polyprenyl synthetase family protein [Eremococcus coleocola]|uniref:polyprenyl synthetase family protein n=1 Tax=Eremococcus coleocola TaxID=88132 RepID=UPI0004282787|nr:farnesyl diphosphate synthase [Eremococcus coleocola]
MTTKTIPELRQYYERKFDKHCLSIEAPLEMVKPMLYSLKNGGKRLRPLMVLLVIDIFEQANLKDGLSTAFALEYIHTYSLIHDDLPAMDNDDLRRGQPTNHVQFDEATAILAGDALLTDAFALIAQEAKLKPRQRLKLIELLSRSAGSTGMVAGQLFDIRAENQTLTIEALKNIHRLKTGRLFSYACQAGAIISDASDKELKLIDEFAQAFGLAYQIHNDLQDVLLDSQSTGKEEHGDESLHKATYPSLLGVDGAKAALETEIETMHQVIFRLTKETRKDFNRLIAFLEYLNIQVKEQKA